MKRPPRVVTFGELLLRLSPPAGETFLESPAFNANFGGAEANVAVALAHLGVPATYVTALPPNPLAGAGITALRAEGVEVRALEVAGSRLGLFFVDLGSPSRPPQTLYDRGHSAFASVSATTFPWDVILAGADWFHCTGITPALGAGPLAALSTALGAARSLHVPVSLDLNYRPALWGDRDPRQVIRPLAERVDVLIANPASASAMLGSDGEDPARIAAATGAGRVALTRRVVLPASGNLHQWSASLYDAATESLLQSKRYRVRAVDRVGGGDCFAAALISQLLRRRNLEEALEFAVVASAHKLGVPGDWSRLDRDAVERLRLRPDPAWS